MSDEPKPASDAEIIDLAANFVAGQKLRKLENMRDRLDTLAKEAAADGREIDRVALDAGSFALTYIIKESQEK